MTDMAEGLRRFVKIGPAEPFRGAAIVWLFGSVPAFAVSTLRPGRLVSRLWRDSTTGWWPQGWQGAADFRDAGPAIGQECAAGTGFRLSSGEIGIREEDRQSRWNVRVEPSRVRQSGFSGWPTGRCRRPGLEDEDGGFQSDPAWLDYVAGMIKAAMAEKTGGSVGAAGNRVLVLTTSYTDAEALAARVDGLEAHRRGTKLDGYIGAFRENPEAALVTPAGWAGLNLPGLVKHLVVARLPFARPQSGGGRPAAGAARRARDGRAGDRRHSDGAPDGGDAAAAASGAGPGDPRSRRCRDGLDRRSALSAARRAGEGPARQGVAGVGGAVHVVHRDDSGCGSGRGCGRPGTTRGFMARMLGW